MKVLTNEAKIHLATKVDDWQIVPVLQAPGFIYLAKEEETDLVQIEDYNPNDPDSAYCMKYLRGIFNAVSEDDKARFASDWNMWAVLNNGKILLEEVLDYTSFKGEVWEK